MSNIEIVKLTTGEDLMGDVSSTEDRLLSCQPLQAEWGAAVYILRIRRVQGIH